MSRYSLVPLNPNHQVAVGFDRAAGSSGATFFIQVFDLNILERIKSNDFSSEEELQELEELANVLILGDDYSNPITSIEQIETALAPYATIPDEIKQQLRNDQITESKLPPTVFTDYIQAQIIKDTTF